VFLTLAGIAAVLAVAGCASSESGEAGGSSSASTTTGPTISATQAKSIWLKKFLSVVEAHGVGESVQHLHSPGVEQECKSEEGAYHCNGIIPEEEGFFIPRHETKCWVAQMVIDRSGHIREESFDSISQYREAFHVEIECHL
jgi:hypothetical protein